MSQWASSSSSGNSRFTFVSGYVQSEARSHAMREHWKHRHKRNQQAKSDRGKKVSRNLLPRLTSGDGSSLAKPQPGPAEIEKEEKRKNGTVRTGIPAQLLCGMSYALASSRPDPFQTCPIHLTSQHQRLLHHCAQGVVLLLLVDVRVG